MKTETKTFVALQSLYKAKAQQDAAEVYAAVRASSQGANISLDDVELFCKNAASIRLIRERPADANTLRTLAGECLLTHWSISDAQEHELNDEYALSPSLMPMYLALLASETSGVESVPQILDFVATLVPGIAEDKFKPAAIEVSRAQGAELHNISALTGGMAAQEIIKLITRQYTPIDNTCVFDGITSRSQIFRT